MHRKSREQSRVTETPQLLSGRANSRERIVRENSHFGGRAESREGGRSQSEPARGGEAETVGYHLTIGREFRLASAFLPILLFPAKVWALLNAGATERNGTARFACFTRCDDSAIRSGEGGGGNAFPCHAGDIARSTYVHRQLRLTLDWRLSVDLCNWRIRLALGTMVGIRRGRLFLRLIYIIARARY